MGASALPPAYLPSCTAWALAGRLPLRNTTRGRFRTHVLAHGQTPKHVQGETVMSTIFLRVCKAVECFDRFVKKLVRFCRRASVTKIHPNGERPAHQMLWHLLNAPAFSTPCCGFVTRPKCRVMCAGQQVPRNDRTRGIEPSNTRTCVRALVDMTER